jgi:hypothetical protein
LGFGFWVLSFEFWVLSFGFRVLGLTHDASRFTFYVLRLAPYASHSTPIVSHNRYPSKKVVTAPHRRVLAKSKPHCSMTGNMRHAPLWAVVLFPSDGLIIQQVRQMIYC